MNKLAVIAALLASSNAYFNYNKYKENQQKQAELA